MRRQLIILFIVLNCTVTFGQFYKTKEYLTAHYNNDGDTAWIAKYIDSSKKTIVTKYYEHNIIKSVEITDSIWYFTDSLCTYYRNGKLSYKLHYGKGFDDGPDLINGDYSIYYENGQAKILGHYYNNYLSGKWTTFYPNGYTQVSGQYILTKSDSINVKWDSMNSCLDTLYINPPKYIKKDDKTYIDFDDQFIYAYGCSKKHGLWKYYNDKGIIIKEERYNFGELFKYK